MDVLQFGREITAVGGRLEWISPFGMGVSLQGLPIGKIELAQLSHILPSVVWLDLSDTGLTDTCLKQLLVAIRLEGLYVDGTKITASGIEALRPLQKLVDISASETHIKDRDILRFRQEGWDVKINLHRR